MTKKTISIFYLNCQLTIECYIENNKLQEFYVVNAVGEDLNDLIIRDNHRTMITEKIEKELDL